MSSVYLSLFFLAFVFPLFSPTQIHGTCLNDQKSYLLQFRGGLCINPIHSVKLVHWKESIDCCKWGGVACDDVGHVVSLNLDHELSSIRNESWKAVFSLGYMEELSLAENMFHSTIIPVELSNLTRLRHLNLSNSGFDGQIPAGLSRMTNLVTIDLSREYRYKPMYVLELGGLEVLVQNLTELREIYLDGVNISDRGRVWSNAFSNLWKLEVLSLRYCHLSGPLSLSLSNLTSLTTLQLDYNDFSSTVPDFFTNFSNLRILTLGSCDLHGQFPEKYFQIPTLVSLDLSNNELLGSIPQFLEHQSLEMMVLWDNNFSGSVPDSIGYLGALTELSLSYCNFDGKIPITLTNLSDLALLYLYDNKFSGSIPPLHRFQYLRLVDLSYNAFTGTIPSKYFNGLHFLAHVILEHNSFSGSFPSSLFALPRLRRLILSHNNFDGEIEHFPRVSSSVLSMLDLSHNNFRGLVPEFRMDLPWLFFFDLSSNSFNGSLRLDVFNRLQRLSTLDLSHNNLTVNISCDATNSCLSSFPQVTELKLASCNLKMFPDLKNRTEMRTLDLSLNSITGTIPNWIWKMSLEYVNLSFNYLDSIQKPYKFTDILEVLDLRANLLTGDIPMPSKVAGFGYIDYSNNYFSSSIPSNIGDYLSDKLEFFSLSNNRISGGIPESICHPTFIDVLDLSNNFLEGRIPGCLFSVRGYELKILNLSGNKLSGHIPDTFLDNCDINTLDLSGNALEGKIPTSLSNCDRLMVLNVGNNHLEDNFPCTLSARTFLRVLVLRSNMFHGEIDCAWDIKSWPLLQILDVAHNNFSGTLPPELFLYCRGMMINSKINARLLQHGIYGFGFVRYYQYNVILTIKGVELKLVKILTIYKVLDFSSNNFQGSIPDAVGELRGLYILNMSHNGLTGTIPGSIGKLEQLGSLDLSKNQLTGMIPPELGNLTFLTVLNVSYNQLIGKIPGGRQMQTFPESSFLGNNGLCGFPLNLSCNHESSNDGLPSSKGASNQKKKVDWQYVSAGVGFSAGLGIIMLLTFCNPIWWQRFNALIIQFLFRVFGSQVQERLYRNSIRWQ